MSSEFAANRASPNGIPLKLLDGYPKFGTNESGQTRIVEKFLVRDYDILNFWLECLPTVQSIAQGQITVWPMRYQDTALFAVNFDCQPLDQLGLPGDPFGFTTGVPVKTFAQLYEATVTYGERSTGGEDDGSENRTEPAHSMQTFSGSAHAITILGEKSSFYQWKGSDGLPQIGTEDVDVKGRSANEALTDPDDLIDHLVQDSLGQWAYTGGAASATRLDQIVPPNGPPGGVISDMLNKNIANVKVIPTVEHTCKIPNRLDPNWTDIVGLLGKVNDNQEYNRFFPEANWPRFRTAHKRPNTILYTGFAATPLNRFNPVTKKTQVYYDCEFRFSERAFYHGGLLRGWNHVWNSDTQTFVVPVLKQSKALYEWGDFSLLGRRISDDNASWS